MRITPELQQYLAHKKWRVRPVGENLAVKTCPFCNRSKWKFWIHASNTKYRCWHCNASGNLYKLKRELGDQANVISAAQGIGGETQGAGKVVPMKYVDSWHKRLLSDTRALEYLQGRGITKETAIHFKLGVQVKDGKRWLAIPHINNGKCYNAKFRSLPPSKKAFRRVPKYSSVLFNADCLAEHQSVTIVEGELDAISMWQAGVKNVVGLTGGAETFLAEWYDMLADKEEVIIVMDADAVGQDGARSIARRLGFDKCKNVLLPLKDSNEVLVTLGADELARSLTTAEKFDVHGVVPVNDVLVQCTTQMHIGSDGLLTPWAGMNRLIGSGWHPGDLVVLSARIKVGKTSWALNVCHKLAKENVPCLVYCLEMKPRKLVEKIVAMERHKAIDDLDIVDYQLARYYLRDMPLYFIEPEWGAKLEVDEVLDKIREGVKRYGIKLLVFDHLHFLCRSLQYITTEVGKVCRAFKLLSEELEIVTILIAQPRKIQGDRIIKYDDIKDSSAIPADADQVVLLHRNQIAAGQELESDDTSEQEVLEPKTLVRIDAARFRAGGECYLHYDGALATFLDWDNRQK